MNNNSLPVEKLDGEFSLYFSDKFIKDDTDILTEKTLCTVLLNLSENNKEKYKDKVVFIKDIPVEKQKEFIECFKTNDKDTINTTLEIIMNDYSKDKTEIFAENKSATIYEHSEIFDTITNHFYNGVNIPTTYCDMISHKNGSFTTKHKPNKKSKKAARRNNRRAKRNNR